MKMVTDFGNVNPVMRKKVDQISTQYDLSDITSIYCCDLNWDQNPVTTEQSKRISLLPKTPLIAFRYRVSIRHPRC